MNILEEKEQRILENAAAVFMRYGIKSVNMDDMAKHLGISKKTLYQFVKDKEDLVNRVIDRFLTTEETYLTELLEKKYNAIEENLAIVRWVMDKLQNLHPSVLFDLEKYHPEAAKRLQENQVHTIFNSVLANLKKGQREGFYRKDFNPEIIAKLYTIRLEALIYGNSVMKDTIKISDMYKEIVKYHIRGVADTAGLEYLRDKLKNIKL